MERRINFFYSEDTRKVKSPCIDVCSVSNNLGYCVGCYRTLREITDWESGTDTDRAIILENCKKRKANTK